MGRPRKVTVHGAGEPDYKAQVEHLTKALNLSNDVNTGLRTANEALRHANQAAVAQMELVDRALDDKHDELLTYQANHGASNAWVIALFVISAVSLAVAVFAR